ncbi:MAG: DUF4179 domain-containing protein [Clostridia bacterium]|nr:DUF4179 domain-containing protein [Clostridia bacterium]
MNKFDEMICGLQRDTEVPDDVWRKYKDTLSKLPDKSGEQKVRKKYWMKYAASAAAMMIIGSGICFANPTLAAKIPFIGKIFEEVQQVSTFSGEYAHKAEILNTENGNTGEESNPEYTVENAGVTFSASEIYCDGLSVFLTAQIKVEQGGLKNLPGNVMYLEGNWKEGTEGKEQMLINDNLEGKVIDDQTFVGMLKLDLQDTDLQNGTVKLDLSMIGYDDINELDAEDNEAFHKIEGEWVLELPFSADTEAIRTIQVNKENKGYCLKEVFVSPYQVITYTDVPYVENKITEAEFAEMMKEKTEGMEDPGLTYEQYMEQEGKSYADCATIIFDQDGEKLQPREESRGHSVSAVQEKEISKLYIYVFDDFDACAEMFEKGMECDAAGKALIFAEVEV